MTAQSEPIHDIAHLGSVELFTPKPDKSLWYFRDLLGMEPVHEAGQSVYLRGYGDYATSTLKLTAAGNAGVGCISWRASSPQALERRAKAIADSRSRHRLDQWRFRAWPLVPFSRSRRPRHGDLLRGAEIRRAGPAAFDAEEPAAEIHWTRRLRSSRRSSGAACERCRGQSQILRRSCSASSCANRCVTTRARPRSAHG